MPFCDIYTRLTHACLLQPPSGFLRHGFIVIPSFPHSWPGSAGGPVHTHHCPHTPVAYPHSLCPCDYYHHTLLSLLLPAALPVLVQTPAATHTSILHCHSCEHYGCTHIRHPLTPCHFLTCLASLLPLVLCLPTFLIISWISFFGWTSHTRTHAAAFHYGASPASRAGAQRPACWANNLW